MSQQDESTLTHKRLHIRLDGDNVPLWNRLSYPRRGQLIQFGLNVLTVLAIFFVLFPIFWMLSTALRPADRIYDIPTPLLPGTFSLETFRQAVFRTDVPTWYVNSIIVTTGVILLTTSTATLGGYGLTRLNIPFKKSFARVILFGYMFPPILLAIPMFILWRPLGWINNYVGLIMAISAVSLPFSLWLMWKFFQTVPESLEESAHMAGATRFRAFYEIALPMAKPGMIAVAIFSYAVAWNQFTMPQVLMNDNAKWVLTQGLFSFVIQDRVLWAQLMAASILTIIPSLLFVFFLQKYLLRGFRAGGIG